MAGSKRNIRKLTAQNHQVSLSKNKQGVDDFYPLPVFVQSVPFSECPASALTICQLSYAIAPDTK
jgi:hypothetical protein